MQHTPADNEIDLYEEMIQKRGLDGRITLSKVNSYADLRKAFMDTDVVLFLTQIKLTKDVPNSIIDGFALGKPVVMTNVVDFAKLSQIMIWGGLLIMVKHWIQE